MEILQLIEELSDIPGVSGDEGAVRAAISAHLSDFCTLTTDPLGNLIAFKRGKEPAKKKLVFSAHMDEIGFIITRIEDSGLLRFAPCGGIDSRVTVGKAVEVGGKRIYGVIGVKAMHQAESKELETPPSYDSLYIDIGAESREEAEKLVMPGDRAVFYAKFQKFGDGRILGRAFDDRAGAAMLIQLAEQELPFDCYFAFTVQEETGCTGAAAVGYSLSPDIAVAVECTTASDIAGVAEDKKVCRQGLGPVVSFMDRGAIYDTDLYHYGMAAGQRAGISVQTKEGIFGGNESRAYQQTVGGARIMAVSLPCRYIHSPSCVLKIDDITETQKLLQLLASELPEI